MKNTTGVMPAIFAVMNHRNSGEEKPGRSSAGIEQRRSLQHAVCRPAS